MGQAIISDLTTALRHIRNWGWMVAVHNDYRQDGKLYTFWLFTHPDGSYVKGEGQSDLEAIEPIYEQILRLGKTHPSITLANRRIVLEAFKTALGASYPIQWVDERTSKGDFSGRDVAVDVFNVPVEKKRNLLGCLREARNEAKILIGSECLFIFHTPEATKEHYGDLVAELTKS